MTGLHGVCTLGVVDVRHHTVTEEADLIIVTREYGIEAKPLLSPPYTNWLFTYDADGKRILDANSNAIRLPRS